MASHNDTGKEGEQLAADWISAKGFTILERNWRSGRHEIDIIARKGKFLHFIEVKTRQEHPWGRPEDSVTRKKFRCLQRAADQYLFLQPGNGWIQFDILSISIRSPGNTEFYFIEDIVL